MMGKPDIPVFNPGNLHGSGHFSEDQAQIEAITPEKRS